MGIVFSFLIGIAFGVGVFRYSVAPNLDNGNLNLLVLGKTTEDVENYELTVSATPALISSELIVTPTTTSPLDNNPSPSQSVSAIQKVSPTPEITATPEVKALAPTVSLIPEPTLTPSTPTIRTVNAPPQYDGFFNQYANQYGVDLDLLKIIAECESKFNNNAIGGGGAYIGLFQFGENTWINYRRLMGMDTNPDLRFGGQESIQTAAYAVSLGRHTSLWPSCSK